MDLIELSESDKAEYNAFVAGQPSGSFLQSWEWGQWQESLGRKAFRFKILDESGIQLASVQFINTPLQGGKYYLYAPYGPVVGENFKFQISNFKFLLQELKQKYPEAIFIRIEPKVEMAGLKSLAKKQPTSSPELP